LRGSRIGEGRAHVGGWQLPNAAKESRIPREQLGEAAQVHPTLREYLKELEKQNPVEELVEELVEEQDQVSTTDPDSTTPPRVAPLPFAKSLRLSRYPLESERDLRQGGRSSYPITAATGKLALPPLRKNMQTV
jgi:hypothetical protein